MSFVVDSRAKGGPHARFDNIESAERCVAELLSDGDDATIASFPGNAPSALKY